MASSSKANGETKRRRRRSPPSADDPFYTTDYIMIGPGEYFAIPQGVDREEMIQFFKDARRATTEAIALHGDGRPADRVPRATVLANSSHRDGAIYRVNHDWHVTYCISDRNETRLEPMMLSDPIDCQPDRETCIIHPPGPMMQIFSLKLAEISADSSPIQLYGYFAVRDLRDPSLNYIFNRSRDDPIMVEQGSLIEMTGPKRGIEMLFDVLIEFDMRIKKGGGEEDDLQLIDGVADYSTVTNTSCKAFMNRIDGDCGAVDVTLALLREAVEATIEVFISKVHESGFDLYLSCFVSGIEKEIHLFHGIINEPCGLRRYVVAVVLDTWMHLKFKVGHRGGLGREIERNSYFKANNHGSASQQINFDQSSISVKATWSPLCI